MPSLVTHHMFSKELLKHLKQDELSRFEKSINIYYTFSQSHDYLFYCNKKEIVKLGHYAHHNKTQEYLINIIKYIKENKLENNPDIIAYIYGSITHYVLDTTCHPYIFYKTGVYRKKETNTKKYLGLHNKIEKHLDAIYYEKYTNKKYYQSNISKEIIKKAIFSNDLINTINHTYKETYDKNYISNYYIQGVKNAKLSYTLFRNDKLGIKKIIYIFLDFIRFKKNTLLSTYSTNIKNPNIDYLNLNNKEWNHPSNPEIIYNYSFEDLFNQSINKTINIIREVNKVLFNNNSIENLLNYIPDLDYSTGTIIKEKKEMRFFEN